jgi:hypothetical protein
MGLYVGPLGIGEVGLICFSHARYSNELLTQKPFRTVSKGEFSEVRSIEEGWDSSFIGPGLIWGVFTTDAQMMGLSEKHSGSARPRRPTLTS